MKITIIGWYGTETIGDRAILAGLISFFNSSFDKFELNIGSLYPFFTRRTIDEDYAFWKKIIGDDIKVSLFDSKKSKEMDRAIKESDLIAMGGGPLMHLDELSLIEYAFKRSKKLGKKTAILGCGVGPIFEHERFRKYLLNIIDYSDLVILRDNQSKDNLIKIGKEFNHKLKKDNIYVGFDPAVECAVMFNKFYKQEEQNYIAVNLRDFPSEYAEEDISGFVNKQLKEFINKLALKYSDREIRLIPMHYFHIGGDDREFLNTLKFEINLKNIYVQNKNLSLVETMVEYQNAYISIGMRFHSVVLQTIVNGKNYILDYTEPKKGKIYGFVKDIDTNKFYDDKYIQLQNPDLDLNKINIIKTKSLMISNTRLIENSIFYVQHINDLMNK